MMSSIPYSRYIVYPVTWYSFLIVLGASLAVFIASKAEKKSGLKRDTVIDLSLWLLPFGIIGARAYYVVFSWNQFREHPLSVFRIWEGGLAIYGGIIAGLLVLLIFCKKRKIPPLQLCDIIVPGLALAQSIGRWGNYFNIEAYGAAVSEPSFCFFPLSVEVPTPSGNIWHLAAFFYESVLDFCIFVFLITAGRRIRRKHGDIFFFYLVLYAAGRLIIEEIRVDSLYAASSVRISQLLSVLLCLFILVHSWLQTVRYQHHFSFPVFSLPLLSILFSLFMAFSLIFPSVLPVMGLGQRLLFLFVYSLTVVCTYFISFASFGEGYNADYSA